MAETTEPMSNTDAAATSALDQTVTRLSRNWVLKQGIFLVVLLVFGVWGLADALHFYPRRGLEDASARLRAYLEAAALAGKLTPGDIKVEDPAAALAELRPRAESLHTAALGPAQDRAAMDARMLNARREWLEALARAWRLAPAAQPVIWPGDSPKEMADAATRTVRFDPVRGIGLMVARPGAAAEEITPQRLLGELVQVWNTRNAVKPLSGYDMFFQWFFVVVGFGGGAWLGLVLVRAASRKFRWDPPTQRLTLPGGASFVPSDVKEFDKRRWHKFYVTIHLNSGVAHTLDLLRYVPLEEWVLAMERTAFPDSVERPAPEPAAADSAEQNAGAASPNN